MHSFVLPEISGRGGATAPLAPPLNPPLSKCCVVVQFVQFNNKNITVGLLFCSQIIFVYKKKYENLLDANISSFILQYLCLKF